MSVKIDNIDEQEFYILLKKYSDNYYNGIPIVSDDYFDELVKKYEILFNKNYLYLGKAQKNNKINLPFYMGSLDKCKTNHQIDIFKNRINENINVIITAKIDGISILFNQKKNILYTRGDGFIGSDVSNLIPYINIIFNKKSKIQTNNEYYIRGELVIFKEDFKLININNKYNSPRNLVAGLVNKYSTRLNKGEKIEIEDLNLLSKINFIGYDILNETNLNYEQKLIAINFSLVSTKYNIISKNEVNDQYLKTVLNHYKDNCNYDIDGLVLKFNVNIIEEDGKNPKYSIAFKNNNEGINTKIINIEWNTTKNNILKPRIQIEPVIIDGSKIEYTTGFNARYIFNNNLGPSSIINIIKSGDVIPYINNIIMFTTPQMPSNEWEWINDVDIKYKVQNDKELFLKRTEYMFEIFEVKGIKSGNLCRLYEYGIDSLKKLLQLDKEKLLNIEGFKDKLSDKFIGEILKLRKNMNDICKLMVSSSLFQNFAEKKMEKIITEIPEIINYIKNNKDKPLLEEDCIEKKLNNIGIKKNAKDFINSLYNFINYYNELEYLIIKNIDNNNVKIDTKSINIPLFLKDHLLICFSGFRNKELESKLKLYNIKVTDKVTKYVTILVVKDLESNSKKMIDAKERNILILDLETFKNNIENN